MIAITGSTGQLGNLVVEEFLSQGTDASELVAIARNPDKAKELGSKRLEVRKADYNDKESFTTALAGIDKLILISSSEVGSRATQHRNVIEAAKEAGVKFIAYTSILRADSSPLGFAKEHLETEKMLQESGISYALLRNGWYNENYTMGIQNALANNGVWGCAGEGRISSAARRDYALAAVKATLRGEPRTYELAGDTAYTLSEFAEIISEITGKDIRYHNLTESEYVELLLKVGLPKVIAEMLADSEKGASRGGLYDDSGDLSNLIGRKTTPIATSIRAALEA